jgi:hypothetical protein
MTRSGTIIGMRVLGVLVAFLGMAAAAAADPEIRVLSTRPELVSDHNALVEVVLPPGTDAGAVRVDVDGRDVTGAFALRPNGRYIGQVEGFKDGENVMTARVPGGGARLRITSSPLGGPVFSGPQIKPWTCFEGALDAQCNRKPVVQFFYKSSQSGSFEAYDPAAPPSDVAETTTDHGVTVPYIVRVETGTLDRDQYRMAVLYDPAKPWAPWDPQPQFNHKLVVTHGVSCDTAYEQAEAPDVMVDVALSRGFAVMSHALDHSGHNCNVALQAEALQMTKERLVETLGELRYTIGSGCSGGALAQLQVANAYPGFYQGITPGCSFPDTWTGRMLYEDYSLLRRYYENPSRWSPGVAWSADQISAVLGHPNYANTIVYNTAIQPILDPSRTCTGVPAEQVYSAENPKGVRCSLQDYMINIFGRREKDGFAKRPWDNSGVLYGLRALIAEKITPQQFVDVNEKAGGRDIDYEPIAERARAGAEEIEIAHRSGAYNTASNLDQVAIIDLRGPDPGAFHDVYRTYALSARLEREHGHSDNHLQWRGSVALMGDPSFTDASILAVDRWLAAVEKDQRPVSLARKLVEDKPADVTDRCTNGAGVDMPEEYCNTVVESYSTARIEAGMPFTDDVTKCQFKPLRRSDYSPIQFSTAEWERLQKVFPDGVCDYGKPPVGFHATVPWQTYRDGPGGMGLGPLPAAESLTQIAPAAPKRCLTRRTLRLRLRRPKADRIVRATVTVNGRRIRTLRGRGVAKAFTLKVRPGLMRVRIVATTRKGRRIVNERRYRICGR